MINLAKNKSNEDEKNFKTKNTRNDTIKDGTFREEKKITSLSITESGNLVKKGLKSILKSSDHIKNSSSMNNISTTSFKHNIKFDSWSQDKDSPLANNTNYSDKRKSKFSTLSTKFSLENKNLKNSNKKESKILETLISEKNDASGCHTESIKSVDSKDTLVRANKFVDKILGRDSEIFLTTSIFSADQKENFKKIDNFEKKNRPNKDGKKTLRNMITSNLGDSNKLIPDVSSIAPLIQVENPELNKVLFNENKNLDGRRKVMYLYNRNDIDLFLEALELKQKRYLEKRYSLVPPQKSEDIINKSPRLRGIFRKCAMEVRIAKDLQKLIYIKKKKAIKNSNTRLKEQEKALHQNLNQFLLDDDVIKPESNLNKVFIYNNKDGQGKVFEPFLDIRNKVDFVEKISENMAFYNKTFFLHSLGYNFSKDDDFIFKDEVVNQEKLLENEFHKFRALKFKKVIDKHKNVENLLDRTNRGTEKLLNQLEEYLLKLKNKNDGKFKKENDIIKSPYLDGLSHLDSNKNNKISSFNRKLSSRVSFNSVKKNYSMSDMASILPKISKKRD